jgi:hypothetical protein
MRDDEKEVPPIAGQAELDFGPPCIDRSICELKAAANGSDQALISFAKMERGVPNVVHSCSFTTSFAAAIQSWEEGDIRESAQKVLQSDLVTSFQRGEGEDLVKEIADERGLGNPDFPKLVADAEARRRLALASQEVEEAYDALERALGREAEAARVVLDARMPSLEASARLSADAAEFIAQYEKSRCSPEEAERRIAAGKALTKALEARKGYVERGEEKRDGQK